MEPGEVPGVGPPLPGTPLRGMPFTVKDQLAVRSVRATAGSRLLESHVAGETAPMVTALQRAGAVVVGKTNCAEFALAPLPGNELFGVTLNPRDASRSVGGSSCGCAAAVAAGLVPFSVGSDYGGSVRYPAECAGVMGFRPALGSVDARGQVPAAPPDSPRARFSVPGLLCRDLDVLERLLRVVMPASERLEAQHDLRVAVGVIPGRSHVMRAAERLAAGGHVVTELGTSLLAEAEAIFAVLRGADDVSDLRTLAQGREPLLTEPMRALLAGTPVPAPQDIEAHLAALLRCVHSVLDTTPVLIAPVTTGPTPLLSDCTGAPEHVEALFRSLEPCRTVTLLGLHALSVPVEPGLSVQIVCAAGHLGVALAVAHAATLAWHLGELGAAPPRS